MVKRKLKTFSLRTHTLSHPLPLLLLCSSSRVWRSLRSSVRATNTLTYPPWCLVGQLAAGETLGSSPNLTDGGSDCRRTDGGRQRETNGGFDTAGTNLPAVAAGVWACLSRCHRSVTRSGFIAPREDGSVDWLQARCEWKQGICLAPSQDVNTLSSQSPSF